MAVFVVPGGQRDGSMGLRPAQLRVVVRTGAVPGGSLLNRSVPRSSCSRGELDDPLAASLGLVLLQEVARIEQVHLLDGEV